DHERNGLLGRLDRLVRGPENVVGANGFELCFRVLRNRALGSGAAHRQAHGEDADGHHEPQAEDGPAVAGTPRGEMNRPWWTGAAGSRRVGHGAADVPSASSKRSSSGDSAPRILTVAASGENQA